MAILSCERHDAFWAAGFSRSQRACALRRRRLAMALGFDVALLLSFVKVKRAIVIGGGPAGLKAAQVIARAAPR